MSWHKSLFINPLNRRIYFGKRKVTSVHRQERRSHCPSCDQYRIALRSAMGRASPAAEAHDPDCSDAKAAMRLGLRSRKGVAPPSSGD